MPTLTPAEFQLLLATFVELAMWSGAAGGVLALALYAIVTGAAQFVVRAMDEREARKRMADRHFAELHDAD